MAIVRRGSLTANPLLELVQLERRGDRPLGAQALGELGEVRRSPIIAI